MTQQARDLLMHLDDEAARPRFLIRDRDSNLDRLLIVGRRQLERIVAAYTLHYNEHRPHRSLEQRPPLAPTAPPPPDEQVPVEVRRLNRLRRRDRLGGLIHEYQLAA